MFGRVKGQGSEAMTYQPKELGKHFCQHISRLVLQGTGVASVPALCRSFSGSVSLVLYAPVSPCRALGCCISQSHIHSGESCFRVSASCQVSLSPVGTAMALGLQSPCFQELNSGIYSFSPRIQ